MRFVNGDFENRRNVYNLYSITIAVQDGKSAPDDEFASIETAASGNNPSREKRLYLPAEPPPPTRGEGAVTVVAARGGERGGRGKVRERRTYRTRNKASITLVQPWREVQMRDGRGIDGRLCLYLNERSHAGLNQDWMYE